MNKCVICDVETLKYKCPKCYARYCSVSCCKTHKAQCSESPVTNSATTTPTPPASCDLQVPNYPLWTAEVKKNVFPIEEHEESDHVSAEQLELLRENDQIKDMLCNPHVRAICENLVNSENPSLDVARAMQEPIFAELADQCLKVVDNDNPHLEPEIGLEMDIL